VKAVIAGTVIATALLVAAGMLGVASAEAPTSGTAATRLVSVEGAGSAQVAQGASAQAADAAYRQAMAAAVTDAQGKAEFLAGKAGATAGAVQDIAEQGGSVQCHDAESRYVEYEGAQPDFGYASRGVGVFASAPSAAAPPGTNSAPKPKKARKRKKHPAKAAVAVSCAVEAQVSLSYALG